MYKKAAALPTILSAAENHLQSFLSSNKFIKGLIPVNSLLIIISSLPITKVYFPLLNSSFNYSGNYKLFLNYFK